MITLFRAELCKLYRRYVPYLSYGAILFVLAMILAGIYFSPGHGRVMSGLGRAGGDFEAVGDPVNGAMVCQAALEFVARILPLMAPIIVGLLLGGEGGEGTLRTMLVRPRSRTQVYFAKWLCGLFYTFTLCAFLYVASYGLGRLIFGGGSIPSLAAMERGKVVILTEREALYYFTLAYGVLTVAVFVTSSLALCLSTFVDNGLAPGFCALGIWLVVQIVQVLPYEWLQPIQPYLFTKFLGEYRHAFPRDFSYETGGLVLPVRDILHTLGYCAAYIAAFTGIGWWRFCTRDVTC